LQKPSSRRVMRRGALRFHTPKKSL
jgi:hypothetical protein